MTGEGTGDNRGQTGVRMDGWKGGFHVASPLLSIGANTSSVMLLLRRGDT